MRTRLLLAGLSALAGVSIEVEAQSYRDLMFIRGMPSAYSTVLQTRAGVLGGVAGEEAEAFGLENTTAWDGHIYYHQDRFGGRDSVLDAYAGRDGGYFGVTEGEMLGQQTQSRLEFSTRYFPFYRDGHYRGDDFIPTGRYEGSDYAVRLTVAREIAPGWRMEIGGFYRRLMFERNEDTALYYVIPEDYDAYGGVMFIENNTLVLDRVTGRPDHGFIATLAAEQESNDSSGTLGIPGVFESSLPSSVWRGRGHLQWYMPQSQSTTWVVKADASMTDDRDRVYNHDAQKPIGHTWVDGSLGFRVEMGLAFWLTPYAKGQLVKILDSSGLGMEQKLFYGGGLSMGYDAASNLTFLLDYSYLSNESREPVSATADTYGEHRFFVGLNVRFGAARK